jgi:hypothetical protein
MYDSWLKQEQGMNDFQHFLYIAIPKFVSITVLPVVVPVLQNNDTIKRFDRRTMT